MYAEYGTIGDFEAPTAAIMAVAEDTACKSSLQTVTKRRGPVRVQGIQIQSIFPKP